MRETEPLAQWGCPFYPRSNSRAIPEAATQPPRHLEFQTIPTLPSARQSCSGSSSLNEPLGKEAAVCVARQETDF